MPELGLGDLGLTDDGRWCLRRHRRHRRSDLGSSTQVNSMSMRQPTMITIGINTSGLGMSGTAPRVLGLRPRKSPPKALGSGRDATERRGADPQDNKVTSVPTPLNRKWPMMLGARRPVCSAPMAKTVPITAIADQQHHAFLPRRARLHVGKREECSVDPMIGEYRSKGSLERPHEQATETASLLPAERQ